MSERKPRFRRVHVPFEITERDIEIARHVARHRFLTSKHFQQLVKGGPQGISRRLQTLFHAGILDRPRAQIDYFHRGGSRKMVYALGNRGAKLLCERGEKSSIDWSVKNRNATKLFIEHTLRIADFMVGLEVACRELNLELNHFTQRLQWRVWLNEAGQTFSQGVIPDAAFSLALPGKEPVHYCVEVDRATMPVRRSSIHLTSVQRKLSAYHATWQQRILAERFACKRFRVLTLTTSPARVQHLQSAARELPSGHGLFLFTDFARFDQSINVLLLPWTAAADSSPQSLLTAQ